jgi:tRNA threonylcarbamoyladenosine biosynthesis protein TsaB
MPEPRILHLETATNVCSVALSEGGKLLALRETDEDRSHGTVLTVFMQEVLTESGLKSTDIDAISVSKGPGSYTGLRIGVSVTKGFAYAQNIPVIGVSTLEVICIAALEDIRLKDIQKNHNEISLCPLLDARRMEVYTAYFEPFYLKDFVATIPKKKIF